MRIVVGLGNPGRKYRKTRHNVGFEVLAELHRRGGSPRPHAKFDSEVVELVIGGEKTLLVSPLTYMNNSGWAVRAVVQFYKSPLTDVLIVCDDFNLELGRLRFRKEGSSGGQKGLNSIIEHLGDQRFSRLRIGVGLPPPSVSGSDFVLSRFRSDEKPTMTAAVQRAADGVETWISSGIDACMNRYNSKVTAAPGPDVSSDTRS